MQKDAFTVLNSLIKQAESSGNGMASLTLRGGGVLFVEVNGGLPFWHHIENKGATVELTTSRAVRTIEDDMG